MIMKKKSDFEFIIFGLILDTINRMFVLLLIIWRCTSEKKIQFDGILSFSVTCTFLIFYCPRIWKNLFKLPASKTDDTATTPGDDSFCDG